MTEVCTFDTIDDSREDCNGKKWVIACCSTTKDQHAIHFDFDSISISSINEKPLQLRLYLKGKKYHLLYTGNENIDEFKTKILEAIRKAQEHNNRAA